MQAQPQRLDLFTPPPPTPQQPLPAEPLPDRPEGDKEPRHHPILTAADMNHHPTQQQQQKAGEQQLSEPEDMEMEGTSRPRAKSNAHSLSFNTTANVNTLNHIFNCLST